MNLNKDVTFLKGNTASTWFSWPPCCEEAHTSHVEGPYVWAPQLTALAGVPGDGLRPTARHVRDSGCSLQDFPVTPRSFLFFFSFLLAKKKKKVSACLGQAPPICRGPFPEISMDASLTLVESFQF